MEQDLISRVKQIAEVVVKKPIPNIEQNLFDSGLVDSLSAVNLLVAIEQKMGVSLDLLEFARREEFTVKNISVLVSAAQKKN